MEIVKYGHIKPVAITCRHCGAKLNVLPRDLVRHHFQEYEDIVGKNFDHFENFLIADCPVCGGWLRFNVAIVPKEWRDMIRSREYQAYRKYFYSEEKENK